MVLTFVSEVEYLSHVSYPRLVAEKGRIPGQFESKFDTLDNLTPELGEEIGEDDVDDGASED
jgi:cell division protein FtsX